MLAHSTCITNTQIAKYFLLRLTVFTPVRTKCEPSTDMTRLASVRKRGEAFLKYILDRLLHGKRFRSISSLSKFKNVCD
jgi:hypothetical protein